MVRRRLLRTVTNTLAFYTIAALLIGYFGLSAYTGNHGVRAREDIDQEIAQLTDELARLKAEHAAWQRKVSSLKPESIDRDMLDERARALLQYADPRDLILQLPAR